MFLHWRKQLVCVCVCVCVNFDWTCWFSVIIYIMCQNTAMKLQTKTKEQFLSQWPNKPIDCELTSQNCPLCYHIFWEWQCSDLIRQKHISLLHFHNSNAECRSVWHYSYITITCCVVLAELEQLKTKKISLFGELHREGFTLFINQVSWYSQLFWGTFSFSTLLATWHVR